MNKEKLFRLREMVNELFFKKIIKEGNRQEEKSVL
jgi:hypothetical protein